MDILTDTISLCEECYRHIRAVKFIDQGQIWLGKACPKHGYTENLIEPDAEFYVNYNYPKKTHTAYFIEVTNKCNLTCPHCYQLPDNTSSDPSIDYIISQIASYEDDGYAISLAGAEPTARKDLDILIKRIKDLPGKPRRIIVLTNGVNLAKLDYAKKFVGIEDLHWTVGLNHPDYHGEKIRDKQLKGIDNCIELGLSIKNISYTLEGLDQLEYCLEEIQQFYPNKCKQFRIRVGADIGRNPDGEQIYLSQLVKATQEIALNKKWSYSIDPSTGIRAHYPVIVNGVYIKLIQWPDVTTLDMEEIQTETWADVLPGKPISPLVHQVILRDHMINNKQMLFDTVPEKYRR
jgi:hypothetical protein